MALLGVGEALKREIAGLVLVDCLLLWGFGRWACLGSDQTDLLGGGRWAKREVGLACCWLIRTVFYRRHQLLPYRWFDRRMTLGPQAMCQTAEVAIIDLWRAFHAAVLTVAGGALGYCFGAIVSKMISCPPQHWHGIARTRGG